MDGAATRLTLDLGHVQKILYDAVFNVRVGISDGPIHHLTPFFFHFAGIIAGNAQNMYPVHNLGLNAAQKPVFRGLRTNAQTSLCIHID